MNKLPVPFGARGSLPLSSALISPILVAIPDIVN